jgi:hypothetical protein
MWFRADAKLQCAAVVCASGVVLLLGAVTFVQGAAKTVLCMPTQWVSSFACLAAYTFLDFFCWHHRCMLLCCPQHIPKAGVVTVGGLTLVFHHPQGLGPAWFDVLVLWLLSMAALAPEYDSKIGFLLTALLFDAPGVPGSCLSVWVQCMQVPVCCNLPVAGVLYPVTCNEYVKMTTQHVCIHCLCSYNKSGGHWTGSVCMLDSSCTIADRISTSMIILHNLVLQSQQKSSQSALDRRCGPLCR